MQQEYHSRYLLRKSERPSTEFNNESRRVYFSDDFTQKPFYKHNNIMKRKTEDRYYNAPIEILKGFLDNPNDVLQRIKHYGMYDYSRKRSDTPDEWRTTSSGNFYEDMRYNSEDHRMGKNLAEMYLNSKVFFGLNREIYEDFYRNQEKEEFDYVCLLAFLAIKSIINTDSYKRMTKLYVLSRMSGLAKSCTDISELPDNIRCWETRYKFNLIKSKLETDWHASFYSYKMRGFSVSFDLKLNKLAIEVEKRTKRYKEKMKKEELLAARKNAIELLYGTAPQKHL